MKHHVLSGKVVLVSGIFQSNYVKLSNDLYCLDYSRYQSEVDDPSSDEEKYTNRSLNPTIGRRHSYNPQRIRSNSIAIFNEDEDDVIFTSYGPIVVEDDTRGPLTLLVEDKVHCYFEIQREEGDSLVGSWPL